jgi:hypothetical protein
MPNRLDFLGWYAHVDELGQTVASLRQNTERAVAGTDDLDGGSNDVAKDMRQRQIGADAKHSRDQGPQAVRVVDSRQGAHC